MRTSIKPAPSVLTGGMLLGVGGGGGSGTPGPWLGGGGGIGGGTGPAPEWGAAHFPTGTHRHRPSCLVEVSLLSVIGTYGLGFKELSFFWTPMGAAPGTGSRSVN